MIRSAIKDVKHPEVIKPLIDRTPVAAEEPVVEAPVQEAPVVEEAPATEAAE